MEIEELEFEMVSLAKDFVSQRRTGEAGLKVMVRMMINKVIESKLHQPTVIGELCRRCSSPMVNKNEDGSRMSCDTCKFSWST